MMRKTLMLSFYYKMSMKKCGISGGKSVPSCVRKNETSRDMMMNIYKKYKK